MGDVVTLRPWSEKEIDFLHEAYQDKNWSVKEICEKLDRTKNMVIGSARRRGLKRPEHFVEIGEGDNKLIRLGKCSRCEMPIFSNNKEDWTDPLVCTHCTAGLPEQE